jgi:2,4-dienoyl-CoA reductase-like NADH-dependent reductase (Old Yellow Enzyme family)/thioredoxin reductase
VTEESTKKVPRFPRLFSPLRIGRVELPNRIVMLPMTTGFCRPDQTVGERFIRFYAQRARGGAGMIVIPFSPIASGEWVEAGIYHDRFLPGVRELTAAIRSHGAGSSCQLITSYHIAFNGHTPEAVAPSPVMNKILHAVPRAVTREEIAFIVDKYAQAAYRAREGGFDAVEILVGAGYLLNRFLSPVGNTRNDAYGGNLENRMRIILEIVARIQQTAGEDFPIGVRLNLDEQMPGGHTIDESATVARVLENTGVQYISSYTGWHESPIPTVAPSLPKGAFAHLAEKIKCTVDIPVIATNRINDPFIAEKIIASGRADLAGMGRALLADPELPDKARHGQIKEIIPCLACSKCLSEIFSTTYKKRGRQFTGVSCVVNPMAGREDQNLMKPAKKTKRVFIVGGGPAGLTAAWTAAKRGHSVTLFEKDSQPGGWLNVGCRPPHKEEILTLSQNLAHRARMAGADIRTDSPADPKSIKLNRPDVLILALGASPFVPDIAGVELPHVVDAVDVLAGNRTVDGDIVIVGGGLVGCETAEFLLGKKQSITSVTIVEMLDRMAENLPMTYRPFFLARLKKMGTRLETQSRVEEITTEGVNVIKIDIPEFFPADAVVLALGLKTDPGIEKRFAGLADEIYSVGDCVKPRMIKEAIAEGFGAGEKI